MKVTIKQWNAVATWRWDMPEDEVCGICRVQFDGTCPTCKYPGDDCTLREDLDAMLILRPAYYVDARASLTFSDYSDWQMRPFLSYGQIS